MMLLVVVLFFSALINLILIFLLVRKYDEEIMNIGMIKGTKMENTEYYELHRTNSFIY